MKNYAIAAVVAILLCINTSVWAKVFLLNTMQNDLAVKVTRYDNTEEDVVVPAGKKIEIHPYAVKIFPRSSNLYLKRIRDRWELRSTMQHLSESGYVWISDTESILITVDKHGTSTISKIE